MHLQWEAEVHSNSKQSGVEANFQGKKALGLYFFCCCSELKKVMRLKNKSMDAMR